MEQRTDEIMELICVQKYNKHIYGHDYNGSENIFWDEDFYIGVTNS